MNRLKSFWNNLNRAFSVSKYDRDWFYEIGGNSSIYSTQTVENQKNAYNKCPAVAAIINRKAKAFTNAKWWVLDQNGKEVNSREAKVVKALMAKPNVLQSWNQFLAQAKVYEQLFGRCYIFALRIPGFRDIVSLWVLPNWIVNTKLTGKFLMQTKIEEIVEKYEVTLNGFTTPIKVEDMLVLNDTSQGLEYPFPHSQSRLVSLQDPVSNIIAAYEARNVLITRRGGIGILSNESHDSVGQIPLKPGEKEELQDEFKKYGFSRRQWQVIITNANLKWQSTTYPTKELMLFEEIEDSVRQIADNYDYPMYLLGFKNGSTFSNVAEAKKSLYQDAIIPEAESWATALTLFFGLPEGIALKVFYDHLDALQKSNKDEAEATRILTHALDVAYKSKVITREEYRLKLDYDPFKFNGNTFYDGNTAKPGTQGENSDSGTN